jgi:DNA-binding response OmpR family regulator
MTQPKLVVIEDNPDYQDLIILAIDQMLPGSSVYYFRDGSSALNFLTLNSTLKNPPHLILTDLKMPRVGGKDTILAVRSHPVLKKIPVVVLSTSDNEKEKMEILRCGADQFFTKPATFAELKKIISDINGRWLHSKAVFH